MYLVIANRIDKIEDRESMKQIILHSFKIT